MNYSFKDFGFGQNVSDPGTFNNKLLNEGAEYKIIKPYWSRDPSTDRGNTVVRPLPVPDGSGNWSPYRKSFDSPVDFGDWIRGYQVAKVGEDRIVFIIHNPVLGPLQMTQSPVHLLRRKIFTAVNEGAAPKTWLNFVSTRHLQGADARRELLVPKPTDVVFCQVLLLQHGNTKYDPTEQLTTGKSIIMMFPKSAARSLIEKLSMTNQEDNYIFNDIIDFKNGAFIIITRTADTATYQVDIKYLYDKMRANIAKDAVSLLSKKLKPWDEILYFPSPEEQVALLCDSGLPADILVYAFHDIYPDAIPKRIYEKAKHSTIATTTYEQHPEAASAEFPPFGTGAADSFTDKMNISPESTDTAIFGDDSSVNKVGASPPSSESAIFSDNSPNEQDFSKIFGELSEEDEQELQQKTIEAIKKLKNGE